MRVTIQSNVAPVYQKEGVGVTHTCDLFRSILFCILNVVFVGKSIVTLKIEYKNSNFLSPSLYFVSKLRCLVWDSGLLLGPITFYFLPFFSSGFSFGVSLPHFDVYGSRKTIGVSPYLSP